jgi:glycosyltransferase involved in cell wall biosynthesis
VEALQQLVPEFPDVLLKIVGPSTARSAIPGFDPLAKVVKLTKRLKLSEHVAVLGELTREELQETYSSADIFVYTSRYENFGQTILEAASFGLPLVVSDVGVARDLVQDGTNGFLLPRDDYVDVLVRYLRALLGNPRLRLTFGSSVLATVRQDYRWDDIVGQYDDLYTRLLNSSLESKTQAQESTDSRPEYGENLDRP